MEESVILKDLNGVKLVDDVYYGGDAGSKEAVYHEGDVWLVKAPKSTRDFKTCAVPYTTSPLSEYLGSQIYQSLGIPVHETMLGIRNQRVVVACKDFTREGGDNVVKRLHSFHEIKNQFMASDIERYSGTGSGTLLDEVLATIGGQRTLKNVAGVKERFWDMFVVDAFLGNGDRNNGNWGLLIDLETRKPALAPVYDNGNAFFNKKAVSDMEKRLEDRTLLQQDAYLNPTCIFKYADVNGEVRALKPFSFIEHTENADCNAAVLRFIERVDMTAVAKIINDVPEQADDLTVMPKEQKSYYLEILQIRLDEVIAPTAEVLRKR